MWITTAFGFYSVVAYDPNLDRSKTGLKKPVGKKKGTDLLVRGRVRADLEQLRHWLPDLVINDDQTADYRFRCVISRTAWAEILTDATMEIDYDSHFKEAAQKGSAQVKGRYEAYMRCWSALATLQPTPPYGGWKDKWIPTKGKAKATSFRAKKSGTTLPPVSHGVDLNPDYYLSGDD